MYTVYILESVKRQKHYIGHTSDLERRFRDHNLGRSRYTKAYVPWKIVYTEVFSTKNEAYAREMQIKSYKGGRAFKTLIQ